jgi:hypothetical protein
MLLAKNRISALVVIGMSLMIIGAALAQEAKEKG